MMKSKEILEKANSKIFPEGTPECLKTHIFKLNKSELNDLLDNLNLLEALKQRWQQEEWCNGIELSAESLSSLLKYNKDLFNKNLELDKKLEAEFEDSADEICKIANERNKLFDENIDLKFDLSALNEAKKIEINYDEKLLKQIKTLKQENKKLKKQNKILSHNSTNIVMTDTKVMKRNLELQQENEKLKARCKAIAPLAIKNEKLVNTIIYLNKYVGFKLLNEEKDIKGNKVYSISPIYEYSNLPKEIYDLFEEVLSDEH